MEIDFLINRFNELTAFIRDRSKTCVFISPSIEMQTRKSDDHYTLIPEFETINHQPTEVQWKESTFIGFSGTDVSGSFDGVLCVGLFSAQNSALQIFEEIAHVTCTDGLLLIAEPLDWYASKGLNALKNSIKHNLTRNGFKKLTDNETDGWLMISAIRARSMLDEFFHSTQLQSVRRNLKRYLSPFMKDWSAEDRTRIAFWGAGEQFADIADQLFPLPYGLKPIGVVDSNKKLHGSKIRGLIVRDTKELHSLNPDVVVVSSQYYQKEILDELSAMGLSEKAFCIYCDDTRKRTESTIGLNRSSPKNNTRLPTLLFVCQVASMPLMKRLRYVRENGHFNMILFISDTPEDAIGRGLLSKAFDEVHKFRDFGELKSLLETTEANLIHAMSYPTIIPAICIKWGTAPVIAEIYDPCRALWAENTVSHCDLEAEDYFCRNAAMIIHKSDPFMFNWLSRECESSVPSMQIIPGVDTSICVEPPSVNSPGAGSPIRLVYAGSLFPSEWPARKYGHAHLIRWIKTLLRQDLQVDVYPGMIFRNCTFSDYHELAETDANFNMHEQTPYEDLLAQLGDYHFGLNYFDYSNTTMRKINVTTAVSSKLFTYVEAGIPVIINNDLHAMAELVDKYQIGLVIRRDDISCLREIIENCDYAQLRKNVIAARKSLDIKNYADKVIDIYNKFLYRKSSRTCKEID